MSNSKSFLFYLDNKEILADLSDAQLGQLLRYLIDFAETGEAQKIADPVVLMAYKFMTAQMRRDMDKYEKKCRKNAENGKKGGRPSKKANGFSESERFSKKPKKAYTDTETDKDTETDTNTDIDTDISIKPVRHKYGEYQNVLLSDADMQKLKTEFPQDYQERIERLSEYMASTGKSYKNHLATIRNWARKDKMQQGTDQNSPVQTENEYKPLNGIVELW